MSAGALRGEGDWLSTLLTLLLVFLVLIYVQPLRGDGALARHLPRRHRHAASPATSATCSSIYGAGFVRDGADHGALCSPRRARKPGARGSDDAAADAASAIIWLILSSPASSRSAGPLDARGTSRRCVYATLPLTIGLFIWRYDWDAAATGPTRRMS